jgi:hypothetical protein
MSTRMAVVQHASHVPVADRAWTYLLMYLPFALITALISRPTRRPGIGLANEMTPSGAVFTCY